MRPVQENDVFHAIAHPARRAILLALKDGEHAASDLAHPFDMTFAGISQHLRVLEQAKLVSVRREGRQRLYRLHPKPLHDVVSWIDEFNAFFGERLDALGDYLDAKHGKRAATQSPPNVSATSGSTKRRPRRAGPKRKK